MSYFFFIFMETTKKKSWNGDFKSTDMILLHTKAHTHTQRKRERGRWLKHLDLWGGRNSILVSGIHTYSILDSAVSQNAIFNLKKIFS